MLSTIKRAKLLIIAVGLLGITYGILGLKDLEFNTKSYENISIIVQAFACIGLGIIAILSPWLKDYKSNKKVSS